MINKTDAIGDIRLGSSDVPGGTDDRHYDLLFILQSPRGITRLMFNHSTQRVRASTDCSLGTSHNRVATGFLQLAAHNGLWRMPQVRMIDTEYHAPSSLFTVMGAAKELALVLQMLHAQLPDAGPRKLTYSSSELFELIHNLLLNWMRAQALPPHVFQG